VAQLVGGVELLGAAAQRGGGVVQLVRQARCHGAERGQLLAPRQQRGEVVLALDRGAVDGRGRARAGEQRLEGGLAHSQHARLGQRPDRGGASGAAQQRQL